MGFSCLSRNLINRQIIPLVHVALSDKPLILSEISCYILYIRPSLILTYMCECGFYLYSIAALLTWETRRKDFSVMMSHHIVTVILISFSYMTRYYVNPIILFRWYENVARSFFHHVMLLAIMIHLFYNFIQTRIFCLFNMSSLPSSLATCRKFIQSLEFLKHLKIYIFVANRYWS